MRPGSLRSRSFAAAFVVAASLLAPAVAPADPHRVSEPAGFDFEAELPTTDGYSMYLRGYGHRQIELDLAAEEPYVTMKYTTVGKVTERGIDANFGQFGRIELNFTDAAKRSVSHSPRCRPRGPDVSVSGPMIGSAEFETLGGVVKLDSEGLKAEGQVSSSPKQACIPEPNNVVFGSPQVQGAPLP